MNKIVFLIAGFLFLSGYVSGADLADSVLIDKKKANKLIKTIKKKQEPKKYGISEEPFSRKDISFTYPEKVRKGHCFTIEIRWKEKLIYEYVVDPNEYKVKMVVDLR